MKRSVRIALAAAALLMLCGGGGLFLWRTGFFAAVGSIDALHTYIDSFAPYSHIAFFLVQFLSVVLAPIPSNLSAAAGGVLFGTWPSFFLTFTAVSSASLLMFALSRALGRPFADRLVSRRLSEKYLDVIRDKSELFLLLAFLFPFFPDDVLCILAGLTALSLGRFALLVLLARPWGLLFASALGGASLSMPLWVMLPIGLAGAAFFLLGLKYGSRVRDKLLTALRSRKR